MSMARVLIVDDEKAITNLIQVSLTRAGYECDYCYDGMTAADKIEKKRYDIILLDIMLPKVDGYELLQYIKNFETPVIFLTAKTSVEDKVKGLRMGAEDYLAKPFDIVELIARIETILRRYHKTEDKIEIGGLVIQPFSHSVTKNGKEIALTTKEYKLLLFFVNNRNIALFREVIYERVWEKDYEGDSRTVDLHVQRMKKKVGWEDKIKTIYKVGYRLEI